MDYTLPIPTGIDYFIQGTQSAMYQRLCAVWGVNDSNYNCFGRSYRNWVDDGYIPEWFKPEREIYIDGSGNSSRGGLFWEDSIAAVSHYALIDQTKGANGIYTARLQLLFFVDLSKIMPGGLASSQGQRLDELCINDVRNFIQAARGYGMVITGECRGVDKVLENYSGAAKKSALRSDMHPRFCFRLDLELKYNPLQNTIKPNIPVPMDYPRTLRLKITNTPNPLALIPVGNGKYIQAQYAPGDTLSPMRIGDGNSYLAGKAYVAGFMYNGGNVDFPEEAGYDSENGIWDRAGLGGFNEPDKIVITILDYP